MQLSIAADEEFRGRPDWENVLRHRVAAISPAWEKEFGIRWEVAVINPWLSENGAGAERLYSALRGGASGGSYLQLGIAGQAPVDDSLGYVAPLTRALVVYDFAQRSESDNAAILSHQLARLFGSWEARPPASLSFSQDTRNVIALTKDVNFQAGIHGMDAALVKKLDQLYSASKGDRAKSPVCLAHARAGEEFLAVHNIEAALVELRQAVAADPGNARLHDDIATALVAANEIPAAIVEYREVVRLLPQSPGPHANLGSLLTRSGHWQEGNAEIRKALELQPGQASLHFTLATALMHTPGQIDAGIAEVRQGLRLDPNSTLGKALLDNAERFRAEAEKTK